MPYWDISHSIVLPALLYCVDHVLITSSFSSLPVTLSLPIHSSPHGPQFVFALGAFVDQFSVMVVGRFIFGYVDNTRDSFNATPSHILLTLHAPSLHLHAHPYFTPSHIASFPTVNLTKWVYILGLVDG